MPAALIAGNPKRRKGKKRSSSGKRSVKSHSGRRNPKKGKRRGKSRGGRGVFGMVKGVLPSLVQGLQIGAGVAGGAIAGSFIGGALGGEDPKRNALVKYGSAAALAVAGGMIVSKSRGGFTRNLGIGLIAAGGLIAIMGVLRATAAKNPEGAVAKLTTRIDQGLAGAPAWQYNGDDDDGEDVGGAPAWQYNGVMDSQHTDGGYIPTERRLAQGQSSTQMQKSGAGMGNLQNASKVRLDSGMKW